MIMMIINDSVAGVTAVSSLQTAARVISRYTRRAGPVAATHGSAPPPPPRAGLEPAASAQGGLRAAPPRPRCGGRFPRLHRPSCGRGPAGRAPGRARSR